MFLRSICVAALVLSLGCQGQSAAPTSAGQAAPAAAPAAGGKQKRVIAVIPKGTTHDFWKSAHAGAQQAADELGVELLWDGTVNEKDTEGQIKIIQGLIVKQVDGICLAPIDRAALIRSVKQAKAAGIPTVVFDSGLDDDSVIVSYVATDNYKGGVMAAQQLAKSLGEEGNVILLRYRAGSESTEQREAGFLETLAKDYPKIKVLSENQRVGSDADEARRTAESLLNDLGSQVSGVFTVCEPNNKGMLKALENKKLVGKVKFVGFDSDPRFVEALREHQMDGLVLQDPVRMGYLSVKTMIDHLDGKPVEKRISTGEHLATPENMDDPEIQKVLQPEQFAG
jgi:ribose transport system substrate-binding protein